MCLEPGRSTLACATVSLGDCEHLLNCGYWGIVRTAQVAVSDLHLEIRFPDNVKTDSVLCGRP